MMRPTNINEKWVASDKKTTVHQIKVGKMQ